MTQVKQKEIVNERPLSYKTVRYGMLVEVLHDDGSYHAGCKVHFFNKKGVLVGNYYKFMPYQKLRIREGQNRQYPRYFMNWNNSVKGESLTEKIKMTLFIGLCSIITRLIKFTEKIID